MPTRRVYFDTSIYLAVFLDEDEREVAEAAITAAEQGITRGYISGLAMVETIGAPNLRAPQGPPKPAWQERLVEALAYFRRSEFTYIEESRRAAERAMELAVEHGLKGADALHVALAEGAGCDEFYSFDGEHLRIEDSLDAMRVMRPYGAPQDSLEI